MGLFKDMRKLSALGKEAAKHSDPASQMRDARAHMQQFSSQAQLNSSPTAVRSPATVLEVRDTGRLLNYQPVFDCDVTVRPDGGIPFPATATVVGAARLTMLAPGSEVTVMHEPGDTQQVSLL